MTKVNCARVSNSKKQKYKTKTMYNLNFEIYIFLLGFSDSSNVKTNVSVFFFLNSQPLDGFLKKLICLQYVLPLDLISQEVFSQWMVVVRTVADCPVPEQTSQVDEDERPDLPWWKIKKWAVHILYRMFERYPLLYIFPLYC